MNQRSFFSASIGLALSVGAGIASSQTTAPSSVLIYGLIDVGVNKGNGGTAANTGANGLSKAWVVKQAASSRLGFRGSEDLGGGMSAQFHIEHRFTPDDGQSASPFWQGRSYVQLTNAQIGSVYLGREYSPAFWTAIRLDPFDWNGVGQLGGSQFAGYLNTSIVRTDNTVGYRSPSLSGLTINAAVSAGEGANGRDQGVNFEYNKAPWYVSAAYDGIKGGPAATDGNRLFNAGLAYDFGVIKPILYAARSKTAGGTRENKFYSVGFKAPAGPGVIKAVYARYNPFGSDNTQQKLALGYEYFFSKRTLTYADLSQGREQNRSNNTAYSMGLRHSF